MNAKTVERCSTFLLPNNAAGRYRGKPPSQRQYAYPDWIVPLVIAMLLHFVVMHFVAERS